MPRNVYFSQAVRSEQNLYEDLIIESLKIFGQDIYYLPRETISKDSILGEDRASKFDDAYMIEAYIEGTDGFEGQGDLYSKFGLEVRDEVNFVLSRKIWDRYVGLQDEINESPRPREGDLIFLPMSNKFFEVMFVEHEQPFYQLSNLPVYRLQCSLYEFNDEDFDTGVVGIDAVEETNAYQVTLDYTTSANNQYTEGEQVKQILTVDANGDEVTSVFATVQKVVNVSNTAGQIQVSNIGVSGVAEFREFVVSSTLPLVGQTSNRSCNITKVYDIGDTGNSLLVDPTDSGGENITFELEGDSFLDFTENNPFGDPSDNY